MALERERERAQKCCELLTEPQNEGSRLQARSPMRTLPSVSFSQLAATPESKTHAMRSPYVTMMSNLKPLPC